MFFNLKFFLRIVFRNVCKIFVQILPPKDFFQNFLFVLNFFSPEFYFFVTSRAWSKEMICPPAGSGGGVSKIMTEKKGRRRRRRRRTFSKSCFLTLVIFTNLRHPTIFGVFQTILCESDEENIYLFALSNFVCLYMH